MEEGERDGWRELSCEARDVVLGAQGLERAFQDYLARSKGLMWNLQRAYAEHLLECADYNQKHDWRVRYKRRFDEAVKELEDYKFTTYDDDFDPDETASPRKTTALVELHLSTTARFDASALGSLP